MSHNDVWVYIEQNNGKIADVSLELLGKAQDLAKDLKVQTAAVLIGSGVKDLAKTLFEYGAEKVYVVDDPNLKMFTSLPYADVTVKLIKEYKPEIVLYGATTTGRDLAPRITSELRTGLTADCTELKIGDYERKGSDPKTFKDILYQIRPAFGGNIIATIVCPEHQPQMATVREGVMKAAEPKKGAKGEIIEFKTEIPKKLLVSEVLERIQEEKEVDLKAADIIVAGGMGVGTEANYKLIKDLAHTLGGEYAVSRAGKDAGFAGHIRQVGQTGTTVRPKLYIACGISGQIQHMAGMSESKRIIAINNDPDAPIFQIAHYGIVGDLNEVVPLLIEAYKSLKK